MSSQQAPITKCPTVEFRYSRCSSWRARASLKRAICESFPKNSIVRKSWVPNVLGSVKINNHELCVSYFRAKRDNEYMIANVIPMEFWMNIPIQKNRKIASEFIPDVITICNCLDKTIRATPGVDLVYWYFKWLGVSTKPVGTLKELSWDE